MRCDLKTISFKRQYPAWLYPGKSDREPGMESHVEPDVDYTLDALNPLTWTAAAHSIDARGCDLAIINWWTLFWAPGFVLIARMLRKRGVRVAYICHNLVDHGSGRLKQRIASELLATADAYLAHSLEQADQLRRLFPGKEIVFHPHPVYDQFPTAHRHLPKRGRLELLFFGFIRPYKGLDILLDALSLLGDRSVHVCVAGESWCKPEALRRYVAQSNAPNIELHLGYVNTAAVADYFERADVVVLPYRSATGSGVAALAYHYNTPVLASRVGGLCEVVEEGMTGFLIPPNAPEALAERLRTLDRDQLIRMRAYIRHCKRTFSWNSLSRMLVGLARQERLNQELIPAATSCFPADKSVPFALEPGATPE